MSDSSSTRAPLALFAPSSLKCYHKLRTQHYETEFGKILLVTQVGDRSTTQPHRCLNFNPNHTYPKAQRPTHNAHYKKIQQSANPCYYLIFYLPHRQSYHKPQHTKRLMYPLLPSPPHTYSPHTDRSLTQHICQPTYPFRCDTSHNRRRQ